MKKWVIWSITFFLSSMVYATPKFFLDKVSFEVASKNWVNTKTALLTVSVNATLTDADLVKTRADIMNKLNEISASDWHLTQFDRSQDSSGLEKLFIMAQARISQADLTNVYQQAKNVSKPGATFSINTIDFKPSLEEFEQIRGQLRESIYQQVNNEITRLNKIYPTQHYSLKKLSFYEGDNGPIMEPRAFKTQSMNAMALSGPPALTVGNELTLHAQVELASNRIEGNNIATNP